MTTHEASSASFRVSCYVANRGCADGTEKRYSAQFARFSFLTELTVFIHGKSRHKTIEEDE